MGNTRTNRKKRQRLNRINSGLPARSNNSRAVASRNVNTQSYPMPQVSRAVGMQGREGYMLSNNPKARPYPRRAARRGRTARYSFAGGNSVTMPRYVMGLLDPFCMEAAGVKNPDFDCTGSKTFRVYGAQTYIGDANGVSATAFSLDPSAWYTLGVGATSTTWAWSINPYPLSDLSSIRDEFSNVRPVNAAVRIVNTAGADASGMVSVSVVYPDYTKVLAAGGNLSAILPTTLTDMTEDALVLRAPLASLTEDEIVTCFFPTSPDAWSYRSTSQPWWGGAISGALGTASSTGWPIVVIVCTNGPVSLASFDVEFVCNYEGLPRANLAGYLLDSNEPPEPSCPVKLAAAMNLIGWTAPSRPIDAAGVSEYDFIDRVSSAWPTAVRLASTAVDVIEKVAKVGAFVL